MRRNRGLTLRVGHLPVALSPTDEAFKSVQWVPKDADHVVSYWFSNAASFHCQNDSAAVPPF